MFRVYTWFRQLYEYNRYALHDQISQAWKDNSDLISNEEYYTHFSDSVYGKDIRIVRPLVQYTDSESTPRWSSPPVPFCYHSAAAW